MKIGSGSHTYEWIEGWAKVPASVTLGYTHGVVEDSKGRIYIHHTGTPSVAIFEPDGTFVSAWGGEYSAGAHGMYLNSEADGEYLYLSTTNQGFVAKTTLDGREIYRIGVP